MLSMKGVAKEFDLRPVLDDISIALERGVRYVLTAQNGSGKTTLLTLMAGLSKPSRGLIFWGNEPLSAKTRQHLGVVLQSTFLYGDLTGRENLAFYASLYGVAKVDSVARDWLRRSGLARASEVPVKAYSKGMKQRLSLARALVHRPQLLLLDEPFDGLDIESKQMFQGYFKDAQTNGAAIFMVTHDQSDVQSRDEHLTLRFGRLVPYR